MQVIKLISQVIADFANGEISQIGSLFDTGLSLQKYSEKSYYKTATLIAASCKSAAVFSGVSKEVKEQMFEYGRHLGLAFQVVDDILDFTQSAEQLGKPQVNDEYEFTEISILDTFAGDSPHWVMTTNLYAEINENVRFTCVFFKAPFCIPSFQSLVSIQAPYKKDSQLSPVWRNLSFRALL